MLSSSNEEACILDGAVLIVPPDFGSFEVMLSHTDDLPALPHREHLLRYIGNRRMVKTDLHIIPLSNSI